MTNQIIYSHDVQWLNKLWGRYYKVIPENCLNYFIDPLEGPDENDGQDDQNLPTMPNIEGNVEEDQEPQVEDDMSIASRTCSQMEPISA